MLRGILVQFSHVPAVINNLIKSVLKPGFGNQIMNKKNKINARV